MNKTMGTTAIVDAIPSGRAKDSNRRPRWFHGLGRTGFAIVLVAALILSLNLTTKYLVTVPLVEWGVHFLMEFALVGYVGTAILLAAVWARNRFPRQGFAQYVVALVAVTLAASVALLLFYLLDVWVPFIAEPAEWSNPLWWALVFGSDLMRFSFVGLVITSAWLYVRTEAEHATAIEQCAIDSARMDQQTAEARLQMLEAQIEPHFLFNTLAHVKRLYDTDIASGAQMLRDLKNYLAVALPQMRATESTLGREVDHAKAYLNIQQIRMGRRLAFEFHVPDELRAARLPPLMLLTLVENAVKHGLNPLREGGRIDVYAAVEDGRLRVRVADTGQGFVKSGGGGTGLANIRARLASQFGAAAQFSLALNSPSGVVATLELPYEVAGSQGSGG